MKKSLALMLICLMTLSGITKSFAQDDSATVSVEPTDTISIDNIEPKFYEEEAPQESSNTTTYAIIGGIVIVGGAAFFFMRKKKK